MPGLFGILRKRQHVDPETLRRAGRRMADAMRHRPWLTTEIWGDDDFCGGRVHLGIHNPAPQPFVAGPATRLAWLDGECFPPSGSAVSGQTAADAVARILDDPAVRAATDGAFNLAAYNTKTRELSLVTDRLGFRPLYNVDTEDWFAFAGEVKALLAILDRTPPLDEVSLRQFFAFDHLLGGRTWWQGIRLLPPAGAWSVSRESAQHRVYWSFADLRHPPLAVEAAEEEFGALWPADVARHSRPGRMPLLLSGGLDSRALLAEMLDQNADLLAVTFGSAQSAEMPPARRVAAMARVPHTLVYLDTANWWHRREEGIWQTDGMVNGNHLHVASTMDVMRTGTCYSPMNIAGDLVFGGSHLRSPMPEHWQEEPAQLLRRWFVRNPFFSFEEAVSASLDDIAASVEGPSSDCFHIRQRLRRYALYGAPVALSAYCEVAFVGLSGALLDLVLAGLHDDQRVGHRFYNRVLVKRYPRFFADFPWQVTGRGLSESFRIRAVRGLRRRAYRLAGIKPRSFRSDEWFVSYPKSVRASRVREKLLSNGLLIDDVLRGGARRVLSESGDETLPAGALIAMLTLEIYLRQITDHPAIVV